MEENEENMENSLFLYETVHLHRLFYMFSLNRVFPNNALNCLFLFPYSLPPFVFMSSSSTFRSFQVCLIFLGYTPYLERDCLEYAFSLYIVHFILVLFEVYTNTSIRLFSWKKKLSFNLACL